MTDTVTHRGFFGDSQQVFLLSDPMVAELERITGKGIGAIYKQVIAAEFSADLLREIIRLGLIGGGMNPEKAAQLCATYATDRPVNELFVVAFEVLDARYSGTEKEVAA